MNKGFISIGLALVIGVVVVMATGGGYGVYKYIEVVNEKVQMEQKIIELKDLELEKLRDQVRENETDSETEFETIEVEEADSEDMDIVFVPFYIKPETANVRPCTDTSSSDCSPLGQYKQNTELKLPYSSINDMPEWVQVDWNGNDAYISKVVLNERKVSETVKTVSAPEVKETPSDFEILTPPVVKPVEPEPVEVVIENEEINEEVIFEVKEVRQTAYPDGYGGVYGSYEIEVAVTAPDNFDVFIPKSTTNTVGAGKIGFSYAVSGTNFSGYEDSEVSCSVRQDGDCKIKEGQTSTITATIWLEVDEYSNGNYSVHFDNITYYIDDEWKTYDINKSTSRINLMY